MSFETVKLFEDKIAEFFGSPYAVAVDCCTHGIELCIRYTDTKMMSVPKRTYISIPFLADKIGIDFVWKDQDWKDYYHITNEIIDAAVLWKRDSYIPGTFMGISFQFQKHLSLGRGGMILCDNEKDYWNLKKMVYDGRHPDIPWREQNIASMGYHYYMTPETAQNGLNKLDEAIKTKPRQWTINDWPDLSRMEIFK